MDGIFVRSVGKVRRVTGVCNLTSLLHITQHGETLKKPFFVQFSRISDEMRRKLERCNSEKFPLVGRKTHSQKNSYPCGNFSDTSSGQKI